jgi:pimeloyl-ACP methyl ester carboxylesterase
MELPPHIVLVHGLGRSKHDMFLLASRIRKSFPNSSVHVFDYYSRSQTLATSAKLLGEYVDRQTRGEPVSFIGHSLGGILVRALDAAGTCRSPMKRLVTLGSPHNGAAIAAYLSRYSLVRNLMGPVLTELGTLSLPPKPRQVEIGCIIGATGTRFGFFPLLGSDNDGLVLTREATLEGCAAQLSLVAFHGLMPFSGRIAHAAATFLAHGCFKPR